MTGAMVILDPVLTVVFSAIAGIWAYRVLMKMDRRRRA